MIKFNADQHQFNPDHFGAIVDLRQTAASGACEIMMVACSDHSTAPDTLSFGGPDQFYVVQVMAACVPSSGETARTSILAGIEYAVGVIQVKHAIVCQHTGCRIIPHWLKLSVDSQSTGLSNLERNTLLAVDESYPEATCPDRINLMIREHLLLQLENLQSHEIVQGRLRDGRLRLHAWLADDETARIQSFDPETGQFVSIEQQ